MVLYDGENEKPGEVQNKNEILDLGLEEENLIFIYYSSNLFQVLIPNNKNGDNSQHRFILDSLRGAYLGAFFIFLRNKLANKNEVTYNFCKKIFNNIIVIFYFLNNFSICG